MTHDPAVKAKK